MEAPKVKLGLILRKIPGDMSLASYVEKQRFQILKMINDAINESDPVEGGYLTPEDFGGLAVSLYDLGIVMQKASARASQLRTAIEQYRNDFPEKYQEYTKTVRGFCFDHQAHHEKIEKTYQCPVCASDEDESKYEGAGI